jgi:trans-aconitate methyltransferase
MTHKWDPEMYEKSSSAQKRWAEEVISNINIKGDERVPDIGCGDGKVTAYIATLLPQGSVLGIDNCLDMISFAQSRFPPSCWHNLSFLYGDARDLQYLNEFDLVVSFAALHWILDHRPVLEGIKRSLKPGGRLFAQFGGRGNAGEFFGIVEEKILKEPWAPYFRDFSFPYGFFEAEEYREWLNQAGLRAKRVELMEKDMVQPDRQGLESWMKSAWLPYLERIPVDLRSDFISEMVAGYISAHPPDKDGLVHVRMIRLEVEAEKA